MKNKQEELKKTSSTGFRLRSIVFWPSFLVASLIVVLNLFDKTAFINITTSINSLIMTNFSWTFSLLTLAITFVAGYLFFSKVGDVKIGGKDAVPMFSKWKWFTITLSTTLSSGLLFWAVAEPLYHLHQPPESLGITPDSAQAALFSMSAMLTHWTYAPYAIYAVPSVSFALVFFNLRKPYSLASTIEPALGHRHLGDVSSQVIDSACLFTLVFGMVSTMGTSVLTLMGGTTYFFHIPFNTITVGIIIIIMASSFITSAASGLHHGITILAKWNTIGLFFIAALLLIFGPTLYQFSFGVEAFGKFINSFITELTFTGAAANDPWPQQWSLYYWATWMAWAPLSAMFLGYISRGYTVRQLIIITMIIPATFSVLWMWIFSGTAIKWDLNSGGSLYHVLQTQGIGNVLFSVFNRLPLAPIMAGIMLLVAFISFVTSAHSNALVMSQICTKGLSANNLKANKPLIIMWGAFIAFITWAMISFAGINGVKMASNIGGFVAIVVVMLMSISAVVLANDPRILKDRVIRDYAKEAQLLEASSVSS